jgi:hypothetical protein
LFQPRRSSASTIRTTWFARTPGSRSIRPLGQCGFIKREGRPSEKEILTSRLIDRPVRPLFPEGYLHETQIIAMVLSADPGMDPDSLDMVGAGVSAGACSSWAR